MFTAALRETQRTRKVAHVLRPDRVWTKDYIGVRVGAIECIDDWVGLCATMLLILITHRVLTLDVAVARHCTSSDAR